MADAGREVARVAVVGAGAVGSWFGGRLAAAGVDVTLVARAAHVDAISRDGLVIESPRGEETIRVRATTDVADALYDADLVLVCVKTPDTEEAARALAAHATAGTIALSLQNGVDNAERIARIAPTLAVFPAVVYVAVAIPGAGRVRHTGRGDLIVPDDTRLAPVAALFERAGVPCARSARMSEELWTKMVMNCAFNAVSALTGRRYGAMIADAESREWMTQAALETVAVANAKGVELDEAGLLSAVWRLADAMPEATSSTAQDLALGRRTEIESLNGYVAREGERLGVPTPVNRMLAERVRAAEAA